MNPTQNKLRLFCNRIWERVRSKKSEINYADYPAGVRVRNAFSNKARFAACRVRRRGYIAHVSSEAFCSLGDNFLSDARHHELMGEYLRGKLWSPILVTANFNHGKCKLLGSREFDVAVFMKKVGQRLITVQVLEDDDVPATQEKLDLLNAGIYSMAGSVCPVLYARITY